MSDFRLAVLGGLGLEHLVLAIILLQHPLSSTLSIFFATGLLSLKPLWLSSFTFLTSSIICNVEKIFAKKPGFCRIKKTEFLILDKVELRGCFKNLKVY